MLPLTLLRAICEGLLLDEARASISHMVLLVSLFKNNEQQITGRVIVRHKARCIAVDAAAAAARHL
jgi:hypothetical protein